jgi:alpha-beta hydrolase superfamily lysophospholipase
MFFTNEIIKSHDDTPLTVYFWDCEKPKGIVHIVHGMGEHAARYDDFAAFLNEHGYLVRSSDLRGHGKTAGSIEKVGLFAMEDGWNKVVKDIEFLNKTFSAKNDLPIIMLGHSMGSFILRTLMFTFPNSGDAYILSATAGHPGLMGVLGKGLAGINTSLMGKKNRTQMMTKLAFGDFNKKYDKRTEKDWLSRDTEVVDKYIADPFCMQIFTSQFFSDMLEGILEINKETNIDKIAKHKPMYLFAGDMDPVGNYGKGPVEVFEKFKKVGVEDIELKIYPEGRHEMLNEINKDEVYNDLLLWLDKRILTE